MKDVSYPLQKAYLLALNGITYNAVAVPVYYQELPDTMIPNNYIIFGPVTSNDDSTFNSADTITSMRVTIHTFEGKYNTGKAVAAIPGEVFQRLYANSQFNLDLSPDSMQMVDTRLSNDLTQDYSQKGTRTYIDRIIILRHRIYHG